MHTFKKEERLCNKKLLEQLFHKGSSFLCYPYRISWLNAPAEQTIPVQVVFSVAKKRYKRAVDRNQIKRRMREVYRLNKKCHLYDILADKQLKLLLAISYIGKEINTFELMQTKMLKAFKEICNAANENAA